MSPIGRIFIVLNLILSGFFLGWASNALGTVQNYKEDLETANRTHADEIAAKDDEISRLQTEKNQHSDDARQFREQRDQEKSSVTSLTAQLDEEKRKNNSMQASITQIQAQLGDYKSMIEQFSADKDRAVQSANEAANERDDAVAAQQEAEMARRDAVEAMQQTEARVAALEAEKVALADNLSALETQLAVLVEVTGVDYSDIRSQPQIEAAVLDVRMDPAPGLVMLNVGKAQDVRPGYTFEIFRGSDYKGQVRVQNVQDQYSSAVIVRQKDGQTIAQGDSAATRL